MSDKSGNAEKVRDFLENNRAAHQHLKELQEEIDLLNLLSHDEAADFSKVMKTSYGHNIYVEFEEYNAISTKALLAQAELVNEYKKKLERMACIVEEF